MVYKLLVEKELKFYENYFDYASELVTNVQDIYYNYSNYNEEKLKKCILTILEIIPNLKKEFIINESYFDLSVGEAILNLIELLQKDFAYNAEKIMSKKIEMEKVEKICDDIMKKLALISSVIYSREQLMIIGEGEVC